MSDDVEADLVLGLREIAGVTELGRFEIEHEGVTFRVDYVAGSSSRLTLTANYNRVAHAPDGREASYRKSAKNRPLEGIRPMSITLRTEQASDRSAKEDAIAREHQTGDAKFDAEVYVDSPTTDEELLNAVLPAPVRAGTMTLLSLGFDSIVIDNAEGEVVALMSGFSRLHQETDAPARIVAAFAALLDGLPPVARASGEHPRRSRLPIVAAVIGSLAFFFGSPAGLYSIAGGYDCTVQSGEGTSLKPGCGGPPMIAILVAAVFAIVAAIVARAIAKPIVSGHSDSHGRLTTITVAAFMWAAFLTFLLVTYIGYASKV